LYLTANSLLKIILVHNTYKQAGGEDVVFDQECQLLKDHGHKVVTYRRSNHEIDSLSLIDRAMLPKRTIWATDTRREFAQLLAREHPDIVHVHNTFMMISPSIYSACKEKGIPLVQTLHNFRLACPAATFFRDGNVCEECVDHGLLRSVYHRCYRDSRLATASVALMLAWHRRFGTWNQLVDRFIVLTEFARNKFVAAGLPAEKIVVKPNFVAPDPGERTHVGEYALFIGRQSPEKGVHTLLQAWKDLPSRCALQIVGDGPERERLESQTRQDGLFNVTFRGRLSHEETLAAIKNARFLVIPSAWYEGFPMAIVEAFACGTPVLCSRLGGMQELIADHRIGLHFTSGDKGDITQKIEWAFEHPAELAQMGREARREYENNYTSEKNYIRLIEIYEQTSRAFA
jgi:glycosyltransferase involved in cell wall biosynthesis